MTDNNDRPRCGSLRCNCALPAGHAGQHRSAESMRTKQARYNASERGRARNARYEASTKGRATRAAYEVSLAGMLRAIDSNAKRRGNR